MNDFVLYNPTKIIFGKNSMKGIAEHIKPFGKKVLITYGKGSIKQNGIYDKVIKELTGFDVREFGGIESNPRVETVRKACKEFKKFDPNFVLAIGGGSVIDATKLIVTSMHYNSDPWDFLINPDTEPQKYIPFGVISTISATGSEMNNGSVITNWATHEKLVFLKDEIYPVFSILDPQNTYSVPKEQTAYGVIDAFSHVLEQYIHTTDNTPLQDRFSESILLTLIENGPKAIENPKDYDARANIMFSACMALNDLISSGTNQDWATHRIEHEISAFYDIPHPAGLAVITTRWMETVKKQKMKKLIQYGKRIWNLSGKDTVIADNAIDSTYNFFQSLGMKMSFGEWNITAEHFPIIIERLTDAKIGETPLSAKQIKEILHACL